MTYQDEIVIRSAPRWAWDTIDDTLFADAQSGAFDAALREEIHAALEAMVTSCENPKL